MKWFRDRLRVIVVSVVVMLLPSLAVAEREMHWRELAVRATLDGDGRLHVEERHVMVFTGDWNGGERRFRLMPDQELELSSVTRLTADGRRVRLEAGDLSRLDEYQLIDGSTLRWRSRRPDQPPFNQTEISVAISYVLSNILQGDSNDLYRLDHDFAFGDRPGVIERYSLDLGIDPAWQPLETVDRRLSRSMLQPGKSVVLRSSLRYVGAGAPEAVQRFASTTLRAVSIVALLGGAALAFWLMFHREMARGRGMPLRASRDIDSRWLAQNVFSMSPELVGALHDRLIAWPEVAAVIARMIVESKLANRLGAGVRGPASNLELWLLVDRETLTGYERELIDALFFSRKTTSTDAVRETYKSVGFDPTRILKAPLEQQSNALLGIRPILGWPTWLALASAIVGLVLSLRLGDSATLPVALAASVGSLGPIWGSALLAAPWSRSVQEPMVKAWPFVVFSGLSVSGLGLLVAFWGPLHSIAALCFVWWGVTGAMVVARTAASRESPRGFALRRNLLAARRYFAEELARPEPRIQDAWLPYLIAFELTSEMDAWQHAFGTATSTYRTHSSPHRSDWNDTTAASSAPSSGWTGGGGCFGGAGASGSWAAAAAGLAVASPHAGTTSSSSSSGSSSSSSGGGGGGGW